MLQVIVAARGCLCGSVSIFKNKTSVWNYEQRDVFDFGFALFLLLTSMQPQSKTHSNKEYWKYCHLIYNIIYVYNMSISNLVLQLL